MLDGLPSVADLDGPNVVDTFSELRQWVRRLSVSGQLQAAGLLVNLERRRTIFSFLCRIVEDRLRRNLARQVLRTLSSLQEWTSNDAISDSDLAVALGESPVCDGGGSCKDVPQMDSFVGSAASSTASPSTSRDSCTPGLPGVDNPVSGAQPSHSAMEAESPQRAEMILEPLAAQAMCILCTASPAVMTFIHGQSGHTACCKPCALEVQRRQGKCPVCRLRFTSIIRNYTV
eukprot:TRINITY_DN63133_c0_g1_i1.p1 TRINITY_DN63133_c0_g1~~TRINITY_DN63133_c0_g1_i1.p1  ORF type:complete len:231 (+),score=16.79 TRINITY_DN63133_c0_g1_i1:102-794(+)